VWPWPWAPVAGLVAGFDRDYGAYAQQIVVPATEVAVNPSAYPRRTLL
jgi:hypothetical protein